MIGLALDQDKKTNIGMIYVIIGNFIGTFTTATLLKLTRSIDLVLPKAIALSEIKLADSWYSILILAFFCGILMYLACYMFYRPVEGYVKIVAVFLSVIVFSLLGFEHSIANMYYFSVSNSWSLHAAFYTIIALAGNAMGSLFIPIIKKYTFKV